MHYIFLLDQKFCFLLAVLCILCISFSSWGRPVSYKGGWTLMQMNKVDHQGLHLHYSPSAHWSIGYKGEYWPKEKWLLQGVQINWLVKRWNQDRSQANIYIKLFGGGAFLESQPTQILGTKKHLAGFLGWAADWENRRIYTAYESRIYFVKAVNYVFNHELRLGVAPYLGDYGDLHTFFILAVEFTYDKMEKNGFLFIPMLRLFKGDYLMEIGMTHKKNIILNTMIRF